MKSSDSMSFSAAGVFQSKRNQGGAALVVALFIFALCTALIVAMKSEFTLYYQRGANILLSEQVSAYLRGAEELASLALIQDYDADTLEGQLRDELTEDWAQNPDEVVPYDLDGGGWLRGGLEDLQGRFNLNTLADRVGSAEAGNPSKDRYTPAQQQFIRLLLALEELELSEQDAILITESIGDWLDADDEPRPDGAEDNYYRDQTPAYRAGNQPMRSVSELRAVAYVTAEVYEGLRPWVAALPDSESTVNILTAPSMVLRTINADNNLQPLTESEGLGLVAYREEESFETVEDFLKNSMFEGKAVTSMTPRLGLSSSYFMLSAEAKVADRQLRLYSVLERKGRSIVAINRTSESLCSQERREGKFCKTAP